jgi:2-iminobutanoate/2-iminopropanoate deaminase
MSRKEIVTAKEAPTIPGAPYSPAIKIGQFIFTAGQVPDDPQADIKTQTRQVLNKIKALIDAASSSLDDVVKCTIYMTNLDEFTSMNEVYGEYFKTNAPARATVQVSRLVKNFKIEIDAIAAIQKQ